MAHQTPKTTHTKTNQSFILLVKNIDMKCNDIIIIVYVNIEIKDSYCIDNASEVNTSELKITYQFIDYPGMRIPELGVKIKKYYFEAKYTKELNLVDMTKGAFFLDPLEIHGYRLGTFFLSRIIKWAKHWPDSDIKDISLKPGQAYSGNKERRNNLYENTGMSFNYADESHIKARLKPMKAADFIIVDTWKLNMEKIDTATYITSLYNENKHLKDENKTLEMAYKNLFSEYTTQSEKKTFLDRLLNRF